ncbi:hypothetical protein MCOR25_007789 [Pyricularia grisea]|nr:hypothetical protein MCOR25_007789 [Pyricularia grisea]
MANLIFAPSSAPLKTIEEIQFGVLAPEEIKNMSVVHVQYPDTMDETRTKPREGGLNDPLLGTTDRQYKCKTCNNDMNNCPGHFGHIELAKPVYHPGFINKTKKILEMVCHQCSKLLCDENNDEQFAQALRLRDPKARFAMVWKACKGKKVCEIETGGKDEKDSIDTATGIEKVPHGGCGSTHPDIRKKALQLYAKVEEAREEGMKKEVKDKLITPEQAHHILKHIPEDDLWKMGLNKDYARPEWLIVTVLPVPPPPVRPSISVDGTSQGMRSEDDLTYKLGDIIRANGNVKQAHAEGAPNHICTEFEELLQYHVATYMDNDIASIPRSLQKSGRPIKSIRARLKGKEGRLRGNLMGKRVDFSARTVITGDANISLHEVGVPRSIARTLTYPETVTPHNIDRLHQYVVNGPNEHPGAKYIVRTDGTRIDLRHVKNRGSTQLEYGQKVERHLLTGDYIIFNRQPSLHKESMMGHQVRVMPYSTFRLNLSVTSPYNADFDGDEMNLHVPQTEETRAEVKELCMVPLNIVSPQRNSPLMGIVQDTLAGTYKLCRRDVFLTKEAVMDIMLWVPDWDGIIPQPAILRPRPRWTGKQIISMVIPDFVTTHQGGDWNPLNDDALLIQSGELMFGLLTKKNVGAASGGIIHICYNEQGPARAMAFLNGCQRVVNYWLLHNGHSIGIGDTIPDPVTIEKIQAHINEQKAEVAELTDLATTNRLEALPGMNIRETFESKVSKALNTAREKAGTTTEKSLKDINNAVTMSRSGSKGSSINISQMTALVGQQIVEGKRIPFGFKYRTLPHFTKDDFSPEARGFVENSYLRGLTPSEFFFHAMAGREGLIDTAVKTAETGYIQRRLVKALEDVAAKYDGTVRNSLGDIIQFIYGEDGLDGMAIEKQKMDHLNISNSKFDGMYKLDVMTETRPRELNALEYGNEIFGDPAVQQLLDEEYDAIKADRQLIREINYKKKDDNDMQLPLNVARVIENAKKLFKIDDAQRSDLRPQDVIPVVKGFLERMVVVPGDDPISKEANYNSSILFKAQLRSRLAFKRLAVRERLNRIAFDHVVGEMESRWQRSFVSPGEMVGVLAAQSIGEPATQMTLNTFHFTGISSKNVTLGVPRLKEILNVSAEIKTPGMVVRLDPKIYPDFKQENAKILRSLVEHTNLRSVTAMTEIYYDPEIQTTTIEEDADMLEGHYLIPEEHQDEPSNQSRWLLRLTLDRQKMLDKNLHIEDVAASIKGAYASDLVVVHSDNNADEQVIRMRHVMKGDEEDKDGRNIESDQILKRLEEHMLDGLTLRGIKGIERAFLNKDTRLVVKSDGSLLNSKDAPECEEWYLDTQGTSLRQVLCVDGVDSVRTLTNDLYQIVDLLGIEAARTALLGELTQVLAFDGSYVNHRHLALLVDVMTYRGSIAAVTRHGINRADTGALMRCSFEETVEILLEAAAIGELDDCRGISENVMLGQLAPMGTGAFEVLLDPKMLETVVSNNARMGLMPGLTVKGSSAEGAATPYDTGSPMGDSGYNLGMASPTMGNFSPIMSGGSDTPTGFATEYGGSLGSMNPYGSGTSPRPTSPFSTSPTSPFSAGYGSYSPTSPMAGYSPTSPMMDGGRYGASSPSFSPSSPSFQPTSPIMRHGAGDSMGYSPTSPTYQPGSPTGGDNHYSPTSPAQFGASPTSPLYSPASPSFSPGGATSPMYYVGSPQHASPTSPNAHYSPTSPSFQRSPAQASPTSPGPYSPTSPSFSPRSPGRNNRNGGQDSYSPTSPSHD